MCPKPLLALGTRSPVDFSPLSQMHERFTITAATAIIRTTVSEGLASRVFDQPRTTQRKLLQVANDDDAVQHEPVGSG